MTRCEQAAVPARPRWWDLPGPGMEPESPALAGGFLSTAPPGHIGWIGETLRIDGKLENQTKTSRFTKARQEAKMPPQRNDSRQNLVRLCLPWLNDHSQNRKGVQGMSLEVLSMARTPSSHWEGLGAGGEGDDRG